MRTIIYVVIIIIAAVIGFFMGSGMNQAMGGARLFAMLGMFWKLNMMVLLRNHILLSRTLCKLELDKLGRLKIVHGYKIGI